MNSCNECIHAALAHSSPPCDHCGVGENFERAVGSFGLIARLVDKIVQGQRKLNDEANSAMLAQNRLANQLVAYIGSLDLEVTLTSGQRLGLLLLCRDFAAMGEPTNGLQNLPLRQP